MSALTIVQDASSAMGLTQPSTIESASDSQVVKMLSLLNRLGNRLNRSFDWQTMVRKANFTTDGSSEYVISASPVSITDFANITTPLIYNYTDNRAIMGMGANEDQLRRMYNITNISDNKFRILNDKLIFDSAIPSGQDLHFEYKSTNWVIPVSGSDKSAFNLDTDTSYLDEELLTLGLIYKFKNEQGLTYDEEFRDYQMCLSDLKDQDKDKRLVDLGKAYYRTRFPDTWRNIPDSF